jgi:membrane-associated phospholipid phosphatase
LQKIARVVSTIGNPISLGLFFGIYLSFYVPNPGEFKYLPLLFSLIVVIPISVYLFVKVKTKEFEDADVSNQQKRNKLYRFSLIAFSLMLLVIVVNQYPLKAQFLAFTFLLHIFISYLINQKVKISMHTSFSFLFSFLFYPINFKHSVFLFVFGFINGWSRLKLNRHQPLEVIFGFILGNLMGIFYVFYLYKFIKVNA